MRVLIAMESSGVIRDTFIRAGHKAFSCDLLPGKGYYHDKHFRADIRDVLNPLHIYSHYGRLFGFNCWDLLIAHPDCTYLTSAGARWFYHPDDKHLPTSDRRPHPNYPDRWAKQEQALDMVRFLLNQDIDRICIENPIGAISSHICKPDQIIQPHQFGHDASKSTCLWLKNLPKLVPTKHIAPRILQTGKYKGAKRWANQSPCGANKLGPSAGRWQKRAETYQGIADAMVTQWALT